MDAGFKMSGVNVSPHTVINLVTQAFFGRCRPTVISDSVNLSNWEVDALSYISSFDWCDLSGDVCEKCFDVFSLLSPDAFCYYLPGVIKASVEEGQPNLIVVSAIVSMLDRSANQEWWDDYFFQRWSLLSVDELSAVEEWVYWLASIDIKAYSDDSLERAIDTLSALKLIKSTKGSE